jgi:hypothetical protein
MRHKGGGHARYDSAQGCKVGASDGGAVAWPDAVPAWMKASRKPHLLVGKTIWQYYGAT